jgi:hypothetical protein
VNNTVATSAMPMGSPGCPDFAFSTASIASARMAFAIRSCCARAIGMCGSALFSADRIIAGAAARGDLDLLMLVALAFLLAATLG